MLNRDRVRVKTLMRFQKESFGGDRSAAGRYAANQRWQGQGKQESAGPDTIAARDIKSPKITQIKYGSINSIGEGTYESDRSKIENYLDELKSVGERILGVQGFKEKFGRTVTSIQDELEDNSRILAGSPLNELARANNLQADLAQLEPRFNVISDERPLARDKANAKSIVKDFKDRLKLLSETPSGRVPKNKIREAVDLENRAEGGRQILQADSQSKALYIIKQLEIVEEESLKKAQHYQFRANENFADRPRFMNLARQEFANAESLGSKYGGAFEVYEALYDTQLER